MALKAFIGFESGSTLEFSETQGTPTISTTIYRGSGSKRAAVISPAGAALWGEIRPFDNANGGFFETGGVAGLWANGDYFVIPFAFTVLPSSNSTFVMSFNGALAECCRIKIDGSGNITLVGTTTSSTIATISANTPHYLKFRPVNGNCALSVDGGAETLIDGLGTVEARRLRIGTDAAETYTLVVDDIMVGDAGYESLDQVITRMDVDGAGASAQWTNGTGTTFAEVDEVPHDGDTTYIQENDAFGQSTFTLESSASAGVSGTIGGVWVCAITAVTTGTGQGQPRMIMGGTTVGNATTSNLSTTYRIMGYFTLVDPSDAGAITTTDLDGTEIGARNPAGTDTKITALYLMVQHAETSPAWTGLAATVTADVASTAAVSTTNTANVTSTAAIASSTNVATSAAISCTVVANVTTGGAIGAVGIQSVTSDASVSTDPAVVTESIVRKAKFGGGVLK